MAAAMVLGSPLYRNFQFYKFDNRKYNFLLNYFGVLNVWHGFVFCKIPISIPLKIETGMHRYFARRYSVRCWYRVPVYSPRYQSVKLAYLCDVDGYDGLLWCRQRHLARTPVFRGALQPRTVTLCLDPTKQIQRHLRYANNLVPGQKGSQQGAFTSKRPFLM